MIRSPHLQASALDLYNEQEHPEWFDLAPTAEVRDILLFGGGRALDLGAGSGRNADCLIAAGWNVTAFELDQRGIELAQQNKSAATWHQTSVIRLSEFVEEDSIDLALDVFGPAGDLKPELLSEYVGSVHRALRPEARWFVQTFLQASEMSAWNELFELTSEQRSSVGRWLCYAPRPPRTASSAQP